MKLKVWGLKRSVFFNNIRIASSDVSYQRRTKEMKKITEAFAKLRVWQLAFLVNLRGGDARGGAVSDPRSWIFRHVP